MKQISWIILGWLALLTTAQAEGNTQNCLAHTWFGVMGKTPVLMEFDYPYDRYDLVGEYYSLTSMVDILLKKDENEESRWQVIDKKNNLSGILTLICAGNALTGDWKSTDGRVTLPIEAGIASASFDCTKANSKTEKMICGNPKLSALDFKMDSYYKVALKRYSTNDAKKLKINQRDWLKKARSICDDESCLRQVYEFRIYEFREFRDHYHKAQTPNILIENVTVATGNGAAYRIGGDQNQRNESFNANLGELEGKITKCSILIDLPAGVRDGNHSYGGICSLSRNGQKSNVMICNDEMVGHFKMDRIDHKATMQELVDYVASNCVGG